MIPILVDPIFMFNCGLNSGVSLSSCLRACLEGRGVANDSNSYIDSQL